MTSHPIPVEMPNASEPTCSHPLADGRRHPFAPSSIRVAQISGFVGLTVLGAFSMVILLVLYLVVDDGQWPLFVIMAWLGVLGLLAVRAWFWPAVAFRHAFFQVDESGLTLWRGVYWRSVQRVPRNRVQHTDVKQGPIARAFGLSTLTLYTAGHHYAAVEVPGLSRQDALALRDFLLPSQKDDAV